MNGSAARSLVILGMIWLERIAAVMGIALVLALGYTAWTIYGASPVPTGYEFPRHSLWGGGPLGLFEGTLVERDGCILTDGGGTVVWPPGSSLSLDRNGEPIVHIGDEELRIGELVRLVGGQYSRAQLASVAAGAAESRCPEPFVLTTGIGD